MPGLSPTVRRRRLAHELRRLREEAGLTIEEVAKELDFSPSKVSRIETAQVGVVIRDVRDLLDLYGVGGAERDLLLRIAREARQKGWWQPYIDLFGSSFVALEGAASKQRIFLNELIPGLFQTKRYARAVLTALLPGQPTERIERSLELRLERQQRLMKENPPDLWVVLGEAALLRNVGGTQVMREQLKLLASLAELRHVTLQVLPLSAGAHAGMEGSFSILTFPEKADQDVVYLEHNLREEYLEDDESIHRYSLLFDHLKAAALSPAESEALLENVTENMQNID